MLADGEKKTNAGPAGPLHNFVRRPRWRPRQQRLGLMKVTVVGWVSANESHVDDSGGGGGSPTARY